MLFSLHVIEFSEFRIVNKLVSDFRYIRMLANSGGLIPVTRRWGKKTIKQLTTPYGCTHFIRFENNLRQDFVFVK